MEFMNPAGAPLFPTSSMPGYDSACAALISHPVARAYLNSVGWDCARVEQDRFAGRVPTEPLAHLQIDAYCACIRERVPTHGAAPAVAMGRTWGGKKAGQVCDPRAGVCRPRSPRDHHGAGQFLTAIAPYYPYAPLATVGGPVYLSPVAYATKYGYTCERWGAMSYGQRAAVIRSWYPTASSDSISLYISQLDDACARVALTSSYPVVGFYGPVVRYWGGWGGGWGGHRRGK